MIEQVQPLKPVHNLYREQRALCEGVEIIQSDFPITIGSSGSDTFGYSMDIDSLGNLAFGQYSLDPDLIGTGQSKRGVLVYVTHYGVVNWCKSIGGNLNSGTFTGSSVLNIDFSPSNLFIGVLLEIEEGGANLYTSFAIIQASDGVLVASVSDYSANQYYRGLQSGQILNLQDTLEMTIFSQLSNPQVGRVIPLTGTLIDYSLVVLPGIISGINVMKRASIVNGFNFDLYIGFGLVNTGINFNNGIMHVDLLTLEITKMNINTINLLLFEPVFLNQLDVIQSGGQDYVGACMSNAPSQSSIAFVLDDFDNFGSSMQKMRAIEPSSGSYDCLAIHLLSSTQLVAFFELDGQGGFLIFDSSSPSSVTQKILTPLAESDTYFKQARMHSLSDIYFTGYTKLSESAFGGAYSFPTYQAMLMKTDSTRTCLSISLSSSSVSVTASWSTSWASIATGLLIVVDTTHSLDQGELFLEDFQLIDFEGVCSTEATVVQSGLTDMTYFVTDPAETQTYVNFQIDGEELAMSYYLEMQDASSVPTPISIDTSTKTISVETSDVTQVGIFDLYLVGKIPSNQVSKEPFSVEIKLLDPVVDPDDPDDPDDPVDPVNPDDDTDDGNNSGSDDDDDDDDDNQGNNSNNGGSSNDGNTDDDSEIKNIYAASLLPPVIQFPVSDQQAQVGTQSQYTFPLVSNEISFSLLDIKIKQLPSFISYQNGQFKFYPFSDELVGNHTIKFTVGLIGWDKLTYSDYYFNVEVLPFENKTINETDNYRPQFKENPEREINIEQNSQLEVSLPEVDARNSFDIIINGLASDSSFVNIDNQQLVINAFQQDIGSYIIDILILDNVENITSLPYAVTINVVENGYGVGENNNETNDNETDTNATLSPFDSWIPNNSSEKENLTAKILYISENRHLVIEFSHELLFFQAKQEQLKTFGENMSCSTYQIFQNGTKSLFANRFKVSSYLNKLLSLELNYDNPLNVQNGLSLQFMIEVQFLQQEPFISKEGVLLDPSSQILLNNIPSQLADDLFSNSLYNSKSYLQKVVTGVMATSTLTSLLSSSSMGYVISFINLMQMVVHLPLICEQMPSNALYLFRMMFKISNFQYLPIQKLEATFFDFTKDEAYDNLFDQAGYNTYAFIQNTDSIFYYLLFLAFITSSFQLFKLKFPTVWLTSKLSKIFCLGFYLGFLNEIYIELVICAFINFFDLYNETGTYVFNNFIMFACFFVVTIYPLYVLWEIRQHKLQLNMQTHKKALTIHPLFDELKCSAITCLFIPFTFLLERCYFALNCFFNKKEFQIQAFMFFQLWKVAFLLYKFPYDSRERNWKELFNEVSTLSISYLMLLFTDFLPGKEEQYNVGWLVVAICLLNVILSNALIVGSLGGHIKKVLLRRFRSLKKQKTKKRDSSYLMNVSRKLEKLQDEESLPKKIKVEIEQLEQIQDKSQFEETKGQLLESERADMSWKEVHKYERKRVEKPISLSELNKFGSLCFNQPYVRKAHISEIKVNPGSFHDSSTPKHTDTARFEILGQKEYQAPSSKVASQQSSFIVNPYSEGNKQFDVGSGAEEHCGKAVLQ